MFDDIDVPSQTTDELDAIKAMLDAAAPWHLECEVVRDAMLRMDGEGCTVQEACRAAVAEWDL